MGIDNIRQTDLNRRQGPHTKDPRQQRTKVIATQANIHQDAEFSKSFITSSDMVDKTVYHTLSDDVLGPALKPYIIQENTASQKGKGVAMFRRQLENDLRRRL